MNFSFFSLEKGKETGLSLSRIWLHPVDDLLWGVTSGASWTQLRSTESDLGGGEWESFLTGSQVIPQYRETLIKKSTDPSFQNLPTAWKLWTKDTEVEFHVIGYKYYIRYTIDTGWIYSV